MDRRPRAGRADPFPGCRLHWPDCRNRTGVVEPLGPRIKSGSLTDCLRPTREPGFTPASGGLGLPWLAACPGMLAGAGPRRKGSAPAIPGRLPLPPDRLRGAGRRRQADHRQPQAHPFTEVKRLPSGVTGGESAEVEFTYWFYRPSLAGRRWSGRPVRLRSRRPPEPGGLPRTARVWCPGNPAWPKPLRPPRPVTNPLALEGDLSYGQGY